jgi:L-aspartate semialdehyde sulfurtransferase ferredoxin
LIGGRMSSQNLRVTFPPQLVTEPIVYQLGRQFDLATNIRRANVTKDRGWVIVELQGEEKEISRAVEWARSRGVTVDLLEKGEVE